jgi:hypothetical protein
MTNTQNNQNLLLESSSITIQRGQLLPFVNDVRVLQHNMNTAPVKDKDQLKEGQDSCNNLSTRYKNFELSAIQSTRG